MRVSGVALTCSPAHSCTPGPASESPLAEEAVTQSWTPAAPHPPARPPWPRGACGTRAVGDAAGCRGCPWGCRSRAGGSCPPLGYAGAVRSLCGCDDPSAFGCVAGGSSGLVGWHRALPESCPAPSHCRHRALRLPWVRGATVSPRQRRRPRHGVGAGGCTERVVPRALCWPCRRCPRRCAAARAASVSQREVEPLPPPRSPRSQAPLARIAFAMTGAATPALPCSARRC